MTELSVTLMEDSASPYCLMMTHIHIQSRNTHCPLHSTARSDVAGGQTLFFKKAVLCQRAQSQNHTVLTPTSLTWTGALRTIIQKKKKRGRVNFVGGVKSKSKDDRGEGWRKLFKTALKTEYVGEKKWQSNERQWRKEKGCWPLAMELVTIVQAWGSERRWVREEGAY